MFRSCVLSLSYRQRVGIAETPYLLLLGVDYKNICITPCSLLCRYNIYRSIIRQSFYLSFSLCLSQFFCLPARKCFNSLFDRMNTPFIRKHLKHKRKSQRGFIDERVTNEKSLLVKINSEKFNK